MPMLIGPRRALLGGGAAFNPLSLFADGTEGFLFDDLDISKEWGPEGLKLFHENFNDPIGASTETVRLALDRTKGVTLGAELVSNGTFGDDTGWTLETGWSVTGGVLQKVSGSGNNQDAFISASLTEGLWYRFAFDYVDNTSSAFAQILDDGVPEINIGIPSGSGSKVLFLQATAGANQVGFRAGDVDACTIDNLSVRQVLGNHANQPTSGSRPSLIIPGGGAANYLSFDGTADHLVTGLLPNAAGMTIAVCFRPTASNDIALGARDNTSTHCLVMCDASSQLAGGWGTDAQTTINISGSIVDTDVVGLLRANSSVAQLWKNGVKGYDAAANGSPGTVRPLAIGAFNNSGTIGNHLAGRIYRAFAIQKYVPDNQVVPLMRWLGAGVVSF